MAFIIDLIIYFLIQILTIAITLPLLEYLSGGVGLNSFLIFLAVIFLNGLIYFWILIPLMESSRHQGTLGKIAMKLRVTDMSGKKISFGRAFLRAVCKQLSGLTMMIGYLIALFDPDGQALHDKLANTLVVTKVNEFHADFDHASI